MRKPDLDSLCYNNEKCFESHQFPIFLGHQVGNETPFDVILHRPNNIFEISVHSSFHDVFYGFSRGINAVDTIRLPPVMNCPYNATCFTKTRLTWDTICSSMLRKSLCQLWQFVKSNREVVALGRADDLATLYPAEKFPSQELFLNLKLLQNALVLSRSPEKDYRGFTSN